MFFLLVGCITAKRQNYVIPSYFEPMSYSQMAVKVAYEKRMAEEYFDKADACYDKGDMQGFLYYSGYALSYGWYSSKVYYKRGVAYESLHNYKRAKKEYKKALKKGYYPAIQALDACKVAEKKWKSSSK